MKEAVLVDEDILVVDVNLRAGTGDAVELDGGGGGHERGVFGREALEEEQGFLKGGLNLDSLDMAGLMLHIESRFGIAVETELLENITTVGDMLDLLETKIASKGTRAAA